MDRRNRGLKRVGGVACSFAVISVFALPALGGVRADCDREAAIYKAGEQVTFVVVSDADGEATYRISEDGLREISSGKVKLQKAKAVELRAALDRPGFLHLEVRQGKALARAGAAIDPFDIQPTAQVPEDFDAFWSACRKELAAVPIDPKLTRWAPYCDDKHASYKINLANVRGKRVYGCISIPKGPGPFPAILLVPGAGVKSTRPNTHLADLGAISMNIIIHNFDVDKPAAFYKEQTAGPLKTYRDIGWNDRDKHYYRDVILGCVRSIDYLFTRDDFDKRHLAVTGSSQGGGLTLITAGLDGRVMAIAQNVAALCEHSGRANGRISGWPHWLRRINDASLRQRVLKTSAYYDAVNFARKYRGPSLHCVGYIDTTCAPTTVMSAYNVLPEPKEMLHARKMGHAIHPSWQKRCDAFWQKVLPLKPPRGGK